MYVKVVIFKECRMEAIKEQPYSQNGRDYIYEVENFEELKKLDREKIVKHLEQQKATGVFDFEKHTITPFLTAISIESKVEEELEKVDTFYESIREDLEKISKNTDKDLTMEEEKFLFRYNLLVNTGGHYGRGSKVRQRFSTGRRIRLEDYPDLAITSRINKDLFKGINTLKSDIPIEEFLLKYDSWKDVAEVVMDKKIDIFNYTNLEEFALWRHTLEFAKDHGEYDTLYLEDFKQYLEEEKFFEQFADKDYRITEIKYKVNNIPRQIGINYHWTINEKTEIDVYI